MIDGAALTADAVFGSTEAELGGDLAGLLGGTRIVT